MAKFDGFPAQALPSSKKNKKWREDCVRWAKDHSTIDTLLVRTTVKHKYSNYQLIDGKFDPADMASFLNPYGVKKMPVPENIPHYPIINAKLNVLRGEEYKRLFDYKVIVTNPNAISALEEAKKQEISERLSMLLEDQNLPESEYGKEVQKMSDYYTYTWQDLRELRGNYFLNHYSKELGFSLMFNKGFMDAMIVGEEIYRCDIVNGEPFVERLNPLKVRVFRSGNSDKIEDADMIVIEDYYPVGKIIDTYHSVLTPEQIKKLESAPDTDRYTTGSHSSFISASIGPNEAGEAYFSATEESSLPYDTENNLRVINVYWKSLRKIKRVKTIDLDTGAVVEELLPEDYITDKVRGEEEKILWINEAWEGTLIGDDIFVNIRPRPIQYNRMSNPSVCHFGIIGSIYNLNEGKPFSLVDMLKPFNAMYNIVHDRLNKLIANNWGKLIRLDLSKVPDGWTTQQWIHLAKTTNVAVENSFNEGKIGASTGKLAGGMNNASSGVIDADLSSSIQSNIQILEYIKTEMSEVAGISRQREGQVYNRETVGGVERATIQSSHITEWLFSIHEDVKKRVLECFLETAKIALRGGAKKFQYILPDSSKQIVEIDGEEFAEADFGLQLDNGYTSQKLNAELSTLAQAALQNGILDFSTVIKMYSSSSISEKAKLIEKNEQEIQQRQQEQAQQQQQLQEQSMQYQQQMAQQEREFKLELQQRELDNKYAIAKLQADTSFGQTIYKHDDDSFAEEERLDLARKNREHNDKMAIEREKLAIARAKLKQTK